MDHDTFVNGTEKEPCLEFREESVKGKAFFLGQKTKKNPMGNRQYRLHAKVFLYFSFPPGSKPKQSEDSTHTFTFTIQTAPQNTPTD